MLVSTVPARAHGFSPLDVRIEDARLRLHFRRVEMLLRARDRWAPPPEGRREARARIFDRVTAYAKRGLFPRNLERPGPRPTPCVIDPSGRDCAVAYLLRETGEADLAGRIAAEANYARVPAMRFPELDTWAARHGLGRDEVALIQPSYPYPYTPADLEMIRHMQVLAGYAWELTALGFTGLVVAVLTLAGLARGRLGAVRPLLCLIVGLILLASAGMVRLVSARVVEEGTAIQAKLTVPEHVRAWPNLYHPSPPGPEWPKTLTHLGIATWFATAMGLGCLVAGGVGLAGASVRRATTRIGDSGSSPVGAADGQLSPGQA
jgi:hypothetical protein